MVGASHHHPLARCLDDGMNVAGWLNCVCIGADPACDSGRPHFGQNRSSADTIVPQPGQVTTGCEITAPHFGQNLTPAFSWFPQLGQ